MVGFFFHSVIDLYLSSEQSSAGLLQWYCMHPLRLLGAAPRLVASGGAVP